ncbi:MAG: lipopolysaccharide ABC transporter substrate-binding protein LptA [Arsenophonus sp. ET-DL9-MAG3]
MKLKIIKRLQKKIIKIILVKKIFIKILLISLIFILSFPALALKSDSKQPIQINSVKQSIDLEKNITIFTENIVIKQGTIDVRAYKVIVTRPNGDGKKMIVEAYGTPVTFYQLQDNGKSIKGYSNKLRYEIEKKLIVLIGNAYLEQLDSNIKGDKITYLIQNQEMEAFSNNGKPRVTTIFLPSQFNYKKNS